MHLQKMLPYIIKEDQSGFIKGQFRHKMNLGVNNQSLQDFAAFFF